MTNENETKRFLDFLFRDGDVMELRTIDSEQTEQNPYIEPDAEGNPQKTFMTYPQDRDKLAETTIPIHVDLKRHVWLGVCPRLEKGSKAIKHGRVLWCDLDASVTSIEDAMTALETSGLPDPSLVVWSGYGVHLYWRLDRPYGYEDLRPHARAVHDALPADRTHDPTRVMRVPGSINYKHGGAEAVYIVDENANTYALTDFPRAEDTVVHFDLARATLPPEKVPLSPEDFDLFATNWLDGQKHFMVLGVAGYLRKNLGYDYGDAMDVIRRLHEGAGHKVDARLVQTVRSTYETDLERVSGTSQLYEMGVMPTTHRDARSAPARRTPLRKPKSAVSIITDLIDIPNQEFWIDGLLGPGLVTLWAAEAKTGKSFAAMQIAHALANGLPLWDFGPVARKRVLYFQVELSQNMVAERARSMFAPGTFEDPRVFAMTDRPAEPISIVEEPELLMDLAAPYDVIIVDPISQVNSNDENTERGVRDTIGLFDQLRAEKKAVMLVHHTRKLERGKSGKVKEPSMADVRGSNAWFGAADAIALQWKFGDAGGTKVKFELRAAPERDPLTLYRLPNGAFTHDFREYARAAGEQAFAWRGEELLN